nr:mannosyl-oligosaccharide 1,2-alpha-mannosidase [Quercus suber]
MAKSQVRNKVKHRRATHVASPSTSSGRVVWLTVWRVIALVGSILALAVLWICWLGSESTVALLPFSVLPAANCDARRDEVRDAFLDSWNAYTKYAWGKDRFHPVSKTGSQMSPNGLGWIIVDSIDTMMIMNLTTELTEARQWISHHLDYNQEQDVNTFETTIRMLGGLLSAHYLSTVLPHASSQHDQIYLSKAVDLGNRLLGAYDSRSGVPFASIMLNNGTGIRSHADAGSSSTAEATTLQIEMKYLAHLTGNGIYWQKAEQWQITTELTEARQWISHHLDYNQEQDVNTFETTIRMLGGLLSAHYLSTVLPHASSQHDQIYLSKAVDLGNRLLGAYDSRSGVPFASIMLNNGTGIRSHADAGSSSTAEATTLQIEMKYLAHLTGNGIYWQKAEQVMKVVDANAVKDGLVPIFIDPNSGRFTTREIRLGSRGDSYYGKCSTRTTTSAAIFNGRPEYLIKQYLHTAGREPVYLDMWQEALAGIERHMIIPTSKSSLNIVAELPGGIGGRLSPKMDHLVCFLPGSIALGATGGLTETEARKLASWNAQKEREMKLARELMKTCWSMYDVTDTGLAPEIVWFKADEASLRPRTRHQPVSPLTQSSNSRTAWREDIRIKPLDAHNLQRPETVESLFMLWRITRDPIYREWGWKIFKAFQEHGRLLDGEGYTSLHDVTRVPVPKRDNMESFWLVSVIHLIDVLHFSSLIYAPQAETLKYLYLLFSPVDYLPLTEVVFNTEAHILPVIKQDKFKTGWQRRRRLTVVDQSNGR